MRQTWGKKIIVILALAVTISPLLSTTANAALLSPRNLTLVAGAGGAGGSLPSGSVNHQFNFTAPSTGNQNIGSIRFQYCTTTEGTCTTPTGLSTTSATMGAQSGATGFSINTTTNGAPYVTRTAASVTAGTAISIQLNAVTNPSTVGTFFVRIQTYSAAALGGTAVDYGVVAASTAQAIQLSGTMPESLIFCTGATVTANCATTTPGTISFDQLFSPTSTAEATSQMAASTNAAQGYSITVNGPTLTSGSATIPGWTTQTASGTTRGISNWGMNLVANTSAAAPGFPGDSANINAASTGTGLKGQPTANYRTPDQFRFVSGESVANSAYDGSANTTFGPTNSQVYTASYAANVAGNQLAGTYTTTLTYICTPTF